MQGVSLYAQAAANHLFFCLVYKFIYLKTTMLHRPIKHVLFMCWITPHEKVVTTNRHTHSPWPWTNKRSVFVNMHWLQQIIGLFAWYDFAFLSQQKCCTGQLNHVILMCWIALKAHAWADRQVQKQRPSPWTKKRGLFMHRCSKSLVCSAWCACF